MIYRIRLLLLLFAISTVGCQVKYFDLSASLPIQEIIQDCIFIESELATGFLTHGTILFTEQARVGQIWRFSSETNRPIQLFDIPLFWGGEASPNGKLFAYNAIGEEDYPSKLVVINVNGDVEFTIPMDEKWGGFYWLNNEQLEVPYFWDGYWQNSSPISDIIDITTGAQETVAPELPEPWIPGGYLTSRLVVWKTAYDPTLTVVGYIRGNEPDQSFVLWDLNAHRVLWELNKWTTRTVSPVWTQDRKRLAVVVINEKEDHWNRFELYLVDRNGNAEKWIDIKEHFKDDSVSLAWSPDNRYLAIIPYYNNQSLLILDTSTGKLLDSCIPANIGIWSPDSRQILLYESNGKKPTAILDISNEQAGYIPDNQKLFPIGWLVNSP